MGLNLSSVLPSGFTAEYYKIVELLDNRRHLSCTLGLYKSKEDADAGKAPVENITVVMASPSVEVLAGTNHIAYAYGCVKEQERFKDAESV